MTPIASIRPTPSMTASVEVDACAAAVATSGPAGSPNAPEETAPSSLTRLAPEGGLHPVAHEPGTALFGAITEKLRAAMNKGAASDDPFKSMGEGVAPAAKAAGKALGQIGSAQ